MSEYRLNDINDYCNEQVTKLLLNRVNEMSVLTRVEAASMSQMFSFWNEIQNTLICAAEEIKRLNAKIAELESQNGTK
jgi:hypothetical protein